MSIFKKNFFVGGLLITTMFMTTSCLKNVSSGQSAGIDLANLDTTANPGNDFYQYACGGWMKSHPLTGEYSRYGSFDEVAENNRKQLNELIEQIASKPAAKGSIEQKIADLYNLAMDSDKLNKDGYSPIEEELQQLGQIKDVAGIQKALPLLMKEGIEPYFSLYVDADPKNSDVYLLQTFQGGLGMGQRDYYLENDTSTTKIRSKYIAHVAKMFELTGFDTIVAKKNATDVMRIETRLAKSAYDNVKLRDPLINYNKMSIEEAKKLVPELNWNELFAGLNLKNIKEISISQKENMQEVGKILKSEPVSAQIAYLQWNLINNASSYLSDVLYSADFNFFGKVMSGVQVEKPRWKRAVSNVNSSLGEAVGQMYVKRYFPPASKERMVNLVKNLQEALGERIKGLSWMTDSTKEKALDKLQAFHVKVGYPDKWRDYSKLDIKKDNYWANIKRSNQFASDYMFSKLGKPVDKDEWQMTPQTVNAYYNPTTNEICFPAGILQYPFFDMKADDAFNYGAIGVVIGHEMTHGFDDQGRQFDKQGNMENWWTSVDADNFKKRAGKLAEFFGNIQVAPGVHANGYFTLGENIADQGGLQVSYSAFQKVLKEHPLKDKDGFTPDQRFFLAYANVWAGNIRPEEILKRTKTDPHSLGKWRVNAALPQIEGWYKAFNVQPGDSMYVAPDKRAIVW